MTQGLDPTRLRDPDPAVRAQAIAAVRYAHLKDPAVLRELLRACRDPAPAKAAADLGPDPFAAFFGGSSREPTIGDLAAERVGKAGLPPDRASAEAVAEVLREDGPAGRLPEVVAAALAETRWEDLPHALRTLVPALDRHDVPLFGAVVALPSAAAPVWIELATRPLRPRLFQELLNHPPSKDALIRSAVDAFAAAAADRGEAELATVCAVLAAWGDPAAGQIARAHEDRLPWLVAIRALDQPEARPALARWLEGEPRAALDGGEPHAGAGAAPAGWWARVAEILRQREPLDDFPTAAWLRAAGDDHGLCASWGVGQPGVAEVLAGWVRAGGDRGLRALLLLVGANAHGPVLPPPEIAEVLGLSEPATGGSPRVPWDEPTLTALAQADPPIPGLLDHLLARLEADPSSVSPAVPALRALGGGRAAAERVLARAEAAPERIVPAGRGLVRVEREGVDLDGLEPLVDPELAARYDAVRPWVRSAPPLDSGQ